MTSSGRVLIISIHGPDLINLQKYLGEFGFEVDLDVSLDAALLNHAARPHDIIILAGPYTWSAVSVRTLRHTASTCPLIVVMGASACEAEAVLMLDLGADDFMPPPVRRRELVSRLQVLLRRKNRPELQSTLNQTIYTFSGFAYHARSGQLVLPSGRNLDLSWTEQIILQTLLDRPRSVISLDEMNLVPGRRGSEESLMTVEAELTRLRRRVGAYRTPLPVRSIGGNSCVLDSDVRIHPW